MKNTLMTILLSLAVIGNCIAQGTDDKIIGVISSGTLHMWNSTGISQSVTLQMDIQTVALELIIPPQTETIIPVKSNMPVIHINTTAVTVWVEQQKVPFEAKKPAVRWRIPVKHGTGVVITNPNLDSVVVDFTLNGQRQAGRIAGNTAIAQFVSWFFYGDVEGTLVIESDKPITINAAQCDDNSCQYLPMN